MKCVYCRAEIRQEHVEGHEPVWVDHTEGDTCEHWDYEQGLHKPEPAEVPEGAPELVGLFDQGDKFESDPDVYYLTALGRKCWNEWTDDNDWGATVPDEFLGDSLYDVLARFDRMQRQWAAARPESPEIGRVFDSGAHVLLVRPLPYEPDGALAPGCIVLCRFRTEYVTWFFNEQDQGCHHGNYHGDDLHAATLNFLERA